MQTYFGTAYMCAHLSLQDSERVAVKTEIGRWGTEFQGDESEQLGLKSTSG